MTSFLNRCVWNPTAGGVTDFVVASAFTGGYTPAQCLDPVVSDGASYHYFAATADNIQHEEGDGVYHAATTTLTRATIRNSSSGGAKVNFSQAPIVTMGGPTTLDIIPASISGVYDTTGTSNTAGGLWTVQGSLSTGIGEPGNINIVTGYVGYDVGNTLSSISNGSPAVFTTAVPHNLFGGQCILLQTTGTLPSPLTTLTPYFVDAASLGTTTFEVSASFGGAVINTTSAGSGTHSYVPGGVITSVSMPVALVAPNSGLISGMQVQFQSTGTLPAPLQPNTNYFVRNSNNTFFVVAATFNGTAIHFTTSGSGTITYQITSLGTTQNLTTPNNPSFIIGPAALNGNDTQALFNIVQIWNTTQDPTNNIGMAGLAFTINNLRYQSQNTFFSQWQALNQPINVFSIWTTPNAASWRIGSSAGNTTPFIDEVSLDGGLTGANIIASSPVTGFSLSGGAGGSVPIDGWLNYGGQKRVTTDFPVTSSAVLVNVTGLSVNVQAARSYAFDVYLTCTDAAAGGVQAAIGGSCTATAIEYDGWTLDSNAIKGQTNAVALGTAVASTTTTATTGIVIRIKGLITVNAGGTLTVQFAQNTSNGTASTVKRGSHFIVQDMP